MRGIEPLTSWSHTSALPNHAETHPRVLRQLQNLLVFNLYSESLRNKKSHLTAVAGADET